MKVPTEDRAYTSNYPVLKEWLDKHEARCVWQLPFGPELNPNYVECHRVKSGHACIITVMAAKRGWEIYTCPSTIDVSLSLADAEKRLGLK